MRQGRMIWSLVDLRLLASCMTERREMSAKFGLMLRICGWSRRQTLPSVRTV